MSPASEGKFQRKFTKDQLNGRHHLTLLPPELNQAFLDECRERDRVPSDLLRIILRERYSSDVRYPKNVEIRPHSGSQQKDVEVA